MQVSSLPLWCFPILLKFLTLSAALISLKTLLVISEKLSMDCPKSLNSKMPPLLLPEPVQSLLYLTSSISPKMASLALLELLYHSGQASLLDGRSSKNFRLWPFLYTLAVDYKIKFKRTHRKCCSTNKKPQSSHSIVTMSSSS
jgi:hypothetical protein